MAHSYRREADQSRIDKMRSMGLAAGGHVDAVADEKMIRKAIGEHDRQLHPGKHTKLAFADGGTVPSQERRDRRARGGAAKSKGAHVNIVIAHPGGGQDMTPPPGAGPLPAPPVVAPHPMPMPPPPASAPMGAPGGAAGGPPIGAMAPRIPMPASAAGMPMRKRGGKVGYPIDDGAGGGKGRLEKVASYGKNADKRGGKT